MRRTKKFTFFKDKEDVFSKYYRAEFKVKDKIFNCVIQFVVYCKALEFGDEIAAKKVYNNVFPTVNSHIENEIGGVDVKYWRHRRLHYYYLGFKYMLIQNPEALEEFLASEDTQIVLGADSSRFWGVGLDMNDSRINNPANWKGKNMIGSLLTQLREDLLKQGYR